MIQEYVYREKIETVGSGRIACFSGIGAGVDPTKGRKRRLFLRRTMVDWASCSDIDNRLDKIAIVTGENQRKVKGRSKYIREKKR